MMEEAQLWRDRAMKLEQGFRELSTLLDETQDLRSLLENKIIENQSLMAENQKLKNEQMERNNQSEIRLTENHIIKLEQEGSEKDNVILKCKREIEALNRRVKLIEEELHRQYRTKIEDLEINFKNELSDKESQKYNLQKKVQELEQVIQYKNEENILLQSELQLNQDQLTEYQNHSKIQLEIKDKQTKEQLVNAQNQIKRLEDKLNQQICSQETNLNELESVLIEKNKLNTKLSDLTSTNQHLIIENEGLKQTLLQFQQQKDQDEYMFEDQKKKETLHLKRYYETLLEQVERENRSLRSLLGQKNRELEEMWNRK